MKFRTGWSVPKYPGDEGSNEDVFKLAKNRQVFAISDGASDSFDSATWARTLVTGYAIEPNLTPSWVERASSDYSKMYDRENLSWSAQGAWDRGSFATLLGLRFLDKSHVRLEAVGDSIAVLVEEISLRESFPYVRPEQFSDRPILLSTRKELNGEIFLADGGLASSIWSWKDLRRPSILVMTDALGEWVLKYASDAIRTVLSVRGQKQFAGLVEAERAAGRLRRDDTSLVIFR